MRTLVFDRPGELLRLAQQPMPTAGPGEVILKVAYCGICGSDVHATEASQFQAPGGTVLGHEYAGVVVESRNPQFAVSARVIGVPLMPCDDCGGTAGSCRDSLGILCPKNRIIGLSKDAPGAYAEYVRTGGQQLLPIPDGVPLDAAALAEPLAVGAHAVRMAGPLLGRRAFVIGAGPIGLAVTAFARMAGARDIVVSEIDPIRRQRAAQLGASALIDPETQAVAETFRATTGGPPEVVFECVGAPGLIRQCIDLAAIRGRVVVVGVYRHEDAFMPRIAIRKEIALQFVLGYVPEDFSLALDLLARDPAIAQRMITSKVGFAELPEIFESLRKPNPHGKVLLDPARA